MTLVNFAVAMAIPRLAARIPGAALLSVGVAATLAGMAWLSRLDTGDTYLAAVALPMLLVGAGQGITFAPMTSSGIAGVRAEDAGAASGLVNTAHQLGAALGLGILVATSAHAGAESLDSAAAVTAHVSAALTGAAVLLAVALLVVTLVIVPARRSPRSEPSPTPTKPITDNLAEEAAA